MSARTVRDSMPETPQQRGDVVLRDVTGDDVPIFYEQQLDPDATRMALFPAREREAFMAHWTRILADDGITTKTIVYGEEVAGNIVSFERFGKLEVGYWIGKPFWGKGIATSALSELLRLVTARPLHARVATSNVGSIRVLEKCGFAIVGYETSFDEAMGEQIEEALLELRR
jgi:RimJ/RimL family protein N-acetyltransferase